MRRYLWASTLVLLAAAAVPTLSHAQQDDSMQRTTQSDDNDANGEWGWLGLLGLAGLMGLKRRDRHDDVTHRQAATR